MPILEHGAVVAAVDLYAASPNAFDGRHEQLAALVGAWAAGGVANADLEFETRRAALAAPDVLRDESTLAQAVGLLMAVRRLDAARAREVLDLAALRAGLTTAALARDVLEIFSRRHINGEP